MSRAAPSWDTLAAVSQALDARDRRSNRPIVPALSGPARPLMPSEITARLRGIGCDISRATSADHDLLGLQLQMVCIGVQVRMLADRIEGLRPVELEDTP